MNKKIDCQPDEYQNHNNKIKTPTPPTPSLEKRGRRKEKTTMSKLEQIYKQLDTVFKDTKTLTVVGGNWGDEGKGKVIDLVMRKFDVAIRFSGGANAGHTVFTDADVSNNIPSRKIVSHLIPCGLAQNKICVMSRGEFFNARLFLKELAETKEALGTSETSPIYIDQQAPLWTPYHTLIEAYIELMRGEKKIGTTNKGIGPLEGLYKLRLSPVVGHLLAPKALKIVLTSLHNVLKPCFDFVHPVRDKSPLDDRSKAVSNGVRAQGLMTDEVPTPETVYNELLSDAEQIKPFVADTSFLLDAMFKQGKKLLFEGAQATGLDAFWGTYPFVSSGNSVAQGACIGTGLPMNIFDTVVVVCKTLPTRVGMGPFPSEMWGRQEAMDFAKDNKELFTDKKKRADFLTDLLLKINNGASTQAEMSQYFQVLGDERGATTGRGRSIGFLDIPWLAYASRINGPKYLALTRFDMLSGIKKVPVVVGYKLDGNVMEKGQVPPPWRISEIEPIMEIWDGFTENIYGISNFADLPQNAQNFIQKIESLINVPIMFIGTGPERDAIIVRNLLAS